MLIFASTEKGHVVAYLGSERALRRSEWTRDFEIECIFFVLGLCYLRLSCLVIFMGTKLTVLLTTFFRHFFRCGEEVAWTVVGGGFRTWEKCLSFSHHVVDCGLSSPKRVGKTPGYGAGGAPGCGGGMPALHRDVCRGWGPGECRLGVTSSTVMVPGGCRLGVACGSSRRRLGWAASLTGATRQHGWCHRRVWPMLNDLRSVSFGPRKLSQHFYPLLPSYSTLFKIKLGDFKECPVIDTMIIYTPCELHF